MVYKGCLHPQSTCSRPFHIWHQQNVNRRHITTTVSTQTSQSLSANPALPRDSSQVRTANNKADVQLPS